MAQSPQRGGRSDRGGSRGGGQRPRTPGPQQGNQGRGTSGAELPFRPGGSRPPPGGQSGGRGAQVSDLFGSLSFNADITTFEDKCLKNQVKPGCPPLLERRRKEDYQRRLEEWRNSEDKKKGKEPKEQVPLPVRPAYATIGKSFLLRANFFELGFRDMKKNFYSYSVKLEPKPISNRIIKDVFEILLQNPRLQKVFGASDMAQEVVTIGEMHSLDPITITLPGKSETKHTAYFKKGYILSPKKVLEQLNETCQNNPAQDEAVINRILNVALTRCQSLDPDVALTGRGRQKSFYIGNKKESRDLGAGLEVLRGFYSSTRYGGNRMLLNLSVSHGTFFKPQRMTDLTDAFMAVYGEDRPLFGRYIKALRIEVRHLPKERNHKGQMVYQRRSCWGVARPSDRDDEIKHKDQQPLVKNIGSSPPNVSFWEKDKHGPGRGGHISVAEYFQRAHGITCRESKPVINVGSNGHPVYMPQEVCFIPEGQIFKGELSTGGRQNMIQFSCRRPQDNFKSIMSKGLDIMGITNDCVRDSNLDIKKQMVAVPARVLPSPSIRYKGNPAKVTAGSWNLVSAKFTKPPRSIPWGVTVFLNKLKYRLTKEGQPVARDTDRVQSAVREFVKCLRSLGMTDWPESSGTKWLMYEPNTYRETFEKASGSFPFRFMLVLMHDGEEKAFNHIKWFGDCTKGFLTHCCKYDKFVGANSQYLANNAMKVNLKFGGVCQSLDPSSATKLLAGDETMVVGLDVTHPTGMDYENFPSIAAIVASTDHLMGQWPGEARMQEPRAEIIDGLEDMLKERIRLWYQVHNRKLPKNILIYRDGVSEGQYGDVIKEELSQVKAVCAEIYGKEDKPEPRISFIIVTKRHNVRFYGATPQDVDKNGNTHPGTVVDRGITRPTHWDFYLQAQQAIMGSARPAHYIVAHDEIFTNRTANPDGKPADKIQEVTHNICYMMGRCTRSVSYCTPAFLADRLCERVRRYAKAHFTKEQEGKGGYDHTIAVPSEESMKLHPKNHNMMAYI